MRRFIYLGISIVASLICILFLYFNQLHLFHILFPLSIYTVIRVFFYKVNVPFIMCLTYVTAVSLTLFAAFGGLGFSMIDFGMDITYIKKPIMAITRRYFFTIETLYIYIASISVASVIECAIRRFKSQIALIIIASALLIFGTWKTLDTTINTVYYDFTLDNLDEGKEIKIIHISDTHSTIYKENELANKIIEENADVIMLTGDIAEEVNPFEGTDILLKQIRDVAPIYYVTGNHEYWASDYDDAHEKLLSYGVNYLENDYGLLEIKGQTLLIAGINDPDSYARERGSYKKVPERLNNLEEVLPNQKLYDVKILLSHRPELVDIYSVHNYDFVLSGHAHGGQVRIPFLANGLFAPNQGFFPKYAGGLYTLDNEHTQMIVSRGLSIEPLPRIFNPPELVVITLKGK